RNEWPSFPAAIVRSADTQARSGEAVRGSFPMAMTGIVKFFNAERGYGVIKPDDGGRDVFVHVTAVERAGLKDLAEGQRITFVVEPDKKGKGPKAVNLVLSSSLTARLRAARTRQKNPGRDAAGRLWLGIFFLDSCLDAFLRANRHPRAKTRWIRNDSSRRRGPRRTGSRSRRR